MPDDADQSESGELKRLEEELRRKTTLSDEEIEQVLQIVRDLGERARRRHDAESFLSSLR